ncbi:hypothetical protein TNCV_4513901 [Trichonephila clavipes]|nr:hypothetical protein TNCV_4513901 [Trichonephila clavipes]
MSLRHHWRQYEHLSELQREELKTRRKYDGQLDAHRSHNLSDDLGCHRIWHSVTCNTDTRHHKNPDKRSCQPSAIRVTTHVAQQPMRAWEYFALPSIHDLRVQRCMGRCSDQMASLKRDPQCLSPQASLCSNTSTYVIFKSPRFVLFSPPPSLKLQKDSVIESDETGNVIETSVDLARQINLEVD